MSPLWRIVSDHLDTFLRHYEERHKSTHGRLAPYVEKVLNQFLFCGDPHQGVTIFKCKECNISLAVPFHARREFALPVWLDAPRISPKAWVTFFHGSHTATS